MGKRRRHVVDDTPACECPPSWRPLCMSFEGRPSIRLGHASVAQGIEQVPSKHLAAGSNPAGGTTGGGTTAGGTGGTTRAVHPGHP